MVARRAHNPKVAGSNPAPATTLLLQSLENKNFFGKQGRILPFYISHSVFNWQTLVSGNTLLFFHIRFLRVARYGRGPWNTDRSSLKIFNFLKKKSEKLSVSPVNTTVPYG